MTAGAPWGATAGDWAHFADVLGLEDDLLPVVSNPSAKIDPKSKLRDLGKTPSRYNQAGLVVGIPKWTDHVTTANDLKRWLRNTDHGICVQTRVVRAIDIDIADPHAAGAVQDFVCLGVGHLPLRRRPGSGKCLLAFRMPGDFAKRILRTAHGAIEFLATGQQFVAVGTHPSGTRYEWVDPRTGELALPREIPELSPAEFEVLWQALVETFGLPEGDTRVRNGLVPVKARSADDLRDPVVAFLSDNDWLLELERDGKAHVRCPWEAEHTTDSGPSASTWFPAGVGGFAQGHYRCLHAHCAGRTDGDFLEAIGYVADDFDVVEPVANATAEAGGEPEEKPLPPFLRDRRTGRPLATINNVLMALRRPDVCGFRIAYDAFRDSLMVGEGDVWEPITDVTYTHLRSRLERRGFEPIGRELIRDAVLVVGTEQEMDTAKDWAASLRWDGVPRIDTFWTDYYGVPDSPYARAVAAYTWTALAGRCIEPGVKADMVPVLISGQGTGKTSSVEALCPIPEAFVEINLAKKDEDIARSLRGKLVGEIAELRGLQTRDAESIKAWVSRRWEEWIPKYREFGTRFARRLLLIGTGNQDEFLDDDTGERRWLPLRVGTVDVAGVAAVRDQLWAEGIERFTMGGIEWQEAQRLAEHEHAKFKVSDTWQKPIAQWLERDEMDQTDGLGRGSRPFQLHDLMVSGLGFIPQKIARKDELRAGKVLRKLGYVSRNTRVAGQQMRCWIRAENSGVLEHAKSCALEAVSEELRELA